MRLKAIWTNYSSYAKFVILVGIILFSAGLFLMVGLFLIRPIFGIDLTTDIQALNDYNNPAIAGPLKLLQLLQSVGAFIVPAFMMAYFIYDKPFQSLGITIRPNWKPLLLGGLGILFVVPLVNWLSVINSNMHLPPGMQGVEEWIRRTEEQAANLANVLLNMQTIPQLLFSILLFAVIPGLGEELIFRGLVQQLFKQSGRSKHISILFTAIIFSAIHMQFLGFFPRLLLGMYLGYLMEWTGCLWIPIFAHFVNNGSAVLFTYFKDRGVDVHADTVGTLPGQSWMVVLSTVLTAAVMWVLYKFRPKQQDAF